MSVVTRKRSENFAIIPNHVADDARLSFEARGVLCYLLAKPDDWKIHVNGIRKAGNIGRDKTYRILQELNEAGYLERVEARGEGGRITGYDYVVYDDPVPTTLPFPEKQEAGAPLPDLPEAGEPYPVQPDAGEPDTENTDAYIKTISYKNPPKAPPAEGAAIAPLLAVWALEHRPDRIGRAEGMFVSLNPTEREQAIRFAPVYQRRQILRAERPHLLAYLRERAWEELDGAPPFDRDGEFVITPEHRDEWSAWLGNIRAVHGEVGVESTLRLRKIVRKTRFPPGTPTTSQEAAA